MPIEATRLLRFSQHFDKFYSRRFQPLIHTSGLSLRELHVLLFLSNNPGYDTAKDITQLRGISKSQVSQAVDFLAAEGYLSRRTDKNDRRVVHLSLTEESLPLVRQAQAVQQECWRLLLDGLEKDQLRLLQQLLETVLKNGERLAEEGDR